MYFTQNAYKTYNQDKVLTASPVELVIMLYEETIKQLKMAGFAIEEKDYERANKSLIKVQDIISELIKCLDLRYEIGQELLKIYDFLLSEIVQINMKKDQTRIAPVVNILTELKTAWVEAKATGGNTYSIEG